MENDLLFSEFEPISAKMWKQKIQYDLKGADYNATLVNETLEGIAIKPFYTAEDLQNLPKFKLSQNHQWNIGQRIDCEAADLANTKALEVLNRGADALVFDLPHSTVHWSQLLKAIDIKRVPIYFNFTFFEKDLIKGLIDQIGNTPVSFFLNCDPIGDFARKGNWHKSQTEDLQLVQEMLKWSTSESGIAPLCTDLSLYQNAGANIVQQLAYGLAHCNEYLQQYTTTFASLPLVTFKVGIGGNYFFEIAKIRALRWVWQSLAKAYSLPTACHILAFPSRRNKTLYDYNVNMLRTTSESMAAILGGADTVCNLPYDALYHKENEFGERIARNQLLLLKEESYFDEAIGAAEGTYYIEALTHQIAEKALALFKQIEASGGLISALRAGIIQKKIKESAAREQELFDNGKLVLLGSNAYQNPEDRMKGNLEINPFLAINRRKTAIAPIIEKRLTEEIEHKRLKDE
ncbi:MAG: methylmalonyl-CoA mutase subunit beta [Bacteroidota bacterium]